jgi:hypothetical protein
MGFGSIGAPQPAVIGFDERMIFEFRMRDEATAVWLGLVLGVEEH